MRRGVHSYRSEKSRISPCAPVRPPANSPPWIFPRPRRRSLCTRYGRDRPRMKSAFCWRSPIRCSPGGTRADLPSRGLDSSVHRATHSDTSSRRVFGLPDAERSIEDWSGGTPPFPPRRWNCKCCSCCSRDRRVRRVLRNTLPPHPPNIPKASEIRSERSAGMESELPQPPRSFVPRCTRCRCTNSRTNPGGRGPSIRPAPTRPSRRRRPSCTRRPVRRSKPLLRYPPRRRGTPGQSPSPAPREFRCTDGREIESSSVRCGGRSTGPFRYRPQRRIPWDGSRTRPNSSSRRAILPLHPPRPSRRGPLPRPRVRGRGRPHPRQSREGCNNPLGPAGTGTHRGTPSGSGRAPATPVRPQRAGFRSSRPCRPCGTSAAPRRRPRRRRRTCSRRDGRTSPVCRTGREGP
mmetsp:Transcript_49391/g.148793  ORF Transcript_49391/g.148793 Transcript_49391/m.148793 type:complete len:405 (-) Transcript_49391:2485-3699(-)